MEDLKAFLGTHGQTGEPPLDVDYELCCGHGFELGNGYGCGTSSGASYTFGQGDGFGSARGGGFANGHGNAYTSPKLDISRFNGETVFHIDYTPTVIRQVRGNVARGYILSDDMSLRPCFIVKQGDTFAHGTTLHRAVQALQAKLYDCSTEEERLQAFRRRFPDFSASYPASELFHWHHILTGSCRQGRELFCASREIDLEKDRFTIYQFIKLTGNSYGGETVRKLLEQKHPST